jgi:hypothetical protein
MFSPGEGYPSETTTSTASQAISPAPSSNPTALSSGAIAGIVIGAITMMALIGILCLICRRKKRRTSQSPNALQGSPSYVSQWPFRQHPDLHRTMYSPNSSPAIEDISPKSYCNAGQSLSPLVSPKANQFSPGTVQYALPQG